MPKCWLYVVEGGSKERGKGAAKSIIGWGGSGIWGISWQKSSGAGWEKGGGVAGVMG